MKKYISDYDGPFTWEEYVSANKLTIAPEHLFTGV